MNYGDPVTKSFKEYNLDKLGSLHPNPDNKRTEPNTTNKYHDGDVIAIAFA